MNKRTSAAQEELYPATDGWSVGDLRIPPPLPRAGWTLAARCQVPSTRDVASMSSSCSKQMQACIFGSLPPPSVSSISVFVLNHQNHIRLPQGRGWDRASTPAQSLGASTGSSRPARATTDRISCAGGGCCAVRSDGEVEGGDHARQAQAAATGQHAGGGGGGGDVEAPAGHGHAPRLLEALLDLLHSGVERESRKKGTPDRGGLQGTRPRAQMALGGPASRGLWAVALNLRPPLLLFYPRT
eukprot:762159-Pyramimonas_sp.AAC.3